MPFDEKFLRQRFQEIMLELEIEQFVRNQEGLTNEVVIVNNRFVFRFAKTEAYTRILAAEIKNLDLVRSRINIAIPTPIYHDEDCMIYPYLIGKPLHHVIVLSLDDRTESSIAKQLGEFLHGLHTTKIAGIDWIPPNVAPPGCC
jgi:aminoglycoside 2''-phosphotransferase